MCESKEFESDDFDSDSDLDDFSLTELVYKMRENEEDICLAQHGYKTIDTVCNTLQGELYRAETIGLCENVDRGTIVTIKRTDKCLYKQNITIQDGISTCIETDCIKEQKILKHLTVDNEAMGLTIDKYIAFFESENYFYLVTQHLDGHTLREFVQKSHQLIRNDQLSFDKYSSAVKYIIWQVAATLHWLHNVFKCAHLDLTLDNIMVTNADFLDTENKSKKINDSLSITICNFGVAEFFKHEKFECFKQGLTIDNEPYISPQIRNNDIYNAAKADTWNLGMVLYECIVGETLYEVEDMWDKPKGGYFALMTDSLQAYLANNNLLKFFKRQSLSLLNSLLIMEETNRLNASQVIQHEWFKAYYKRCYKKFNRKIENDKKLPQNQTEQMDKFPFYLF